MKITDVVKSIVNTDQPVCPNLSRSFLQSDYALLIVRRLNEFLQQYPEMRDVVFMIAAYPAIKWVLEAEKSGEALLRLLVDKNNAALFHQSRAVAENISEMNLNALVECRREYLSACRTLVVAIEDALTKIGTYPDRGGKYQDILGVALGVSNTTKKEASRYNINKYFPDALKLMHHCMIEESITVNKVLSGALPSDEKNTSIYHNVIQLLQEYTQLLWLSKNSKESVWGPAKQYLEIFDEVINCIREFPAAGNIYYDIAQTIIKLKPLGIPDEIAAERLEMSTYTYSVKKRRTLLVLGSMLFCCEGDIYMKLLLDKG